MSGKYLLDTCILIALFADETAVKEKLAQASEVFIPSIAVGELYYGAWKSQRCRENVAQVDELVAGSVVLSCNAETGRWYGEVKNALRLKGRPSPRMICGLRRLRWNTIWLWQRGTRTLERLTI
jgi:tRNA(fMet)-specific endonuclease VapC